jgi:two-component system sensor histidine kinase QseC
VRQHGTSIRRRLLIFLLTVVSAAWVTSGYLIYRDALDEVEEVFDANLAQTARVLLGLLGHEVKEEEEIQRDVEAVVRGLGEEGRRHYPVIASLLSRYTGKGELSHLRLVERGEGPGHRYESKLALLCRHAGGAVLIRSPRAPDFPRAADGFSDFHSGSSQWRVFSLTDPQSGVLVQVGEHQAVRQELVREITRNALTPLPFALPLLALLVWLGVGEGLRPLSRVAEEVERREPDALDPMPEGGSPKEVRPLVRALNALFQRLDRALKEERLFTADAAHELRTPLAALRIHAQVALRAEDPTRRRQALERIVEGVDRATHLVEQLLTLARADTQAEGGLTLADVDLKAVASDVLEELAPWALARGTEVSLEGEAATVDGDQPGLRILLRNLVDNAVRYTPAGGIVGVRVETGADAVVLTVTDTGPGIPPAQRAAVLERFHRGETAGMSGSGLGLSIVQRIAELHGARLDLTEGRAGQGLSVRVSFPAPAARA